MTKIFILMAAVIVSTSVLLESTWAIDLTKTKKCAGAISLSFERVVANGEFKLNHANKDNTNQRNICLVPDGGVANANYRIELLSADGKDLLFSQKFYLSPWQYYDGELQNEHSEEGKHGGVVKAQSNSYTNMNLPLLSNEKNIRFRISDLNSKKIVGLGVIP